MRCEIEVDYAYKGVRSYRVSSQKLERVLGIRPIVSVEDSVREMVDKIQKYRFTDFDHPRYYNIRWTKTLEEAYKVVKVTGSVFGAGGEET